MIDLRNRELPCSIESKGVTYPIETDFRRWIAWQHAYEEEGVAEFSIFHKRRPPLDDREWPSAALEFLASPSATPNYSRHASGVRTLDLVLDGEYIVASFQSAYGIDLTDPGLTMHWHRFKALLGGLTDETKVGQIIGYRAWKKSSRSHDSIMSEQREAWRLPDKGNEKAMEEARAIAQALYEMQNGGADGC